MVGALIRALDRAESKPAVSALTWALEKLTGIETKDIILGGFNTLGVGDALAPGAAWLQDNGYYRILAALGGNGVSYSGISINPDSAMEFGAVYACIKIISEDMGTLPFLTYRQAADRTVEEAYDHPLYQALHDLPNPELGAGEFVEMLTAHAALGLDGFAEIQRVGKKIYLWPWMPQDVRIERNSRGTLVYIRRESINGPEKTYTRDQVFQLRAFTVNGIRGDQILLRARHSIGIGLAAQQYAGRFFAQDASPGIILERPAGAASLSPENVGAVKKAWKEWHQGVARSHEPAILQDGTTAKRLDPDHQKLQLIETRKYQVIEACRLFRMPPHKLADLDRATFANIEHLNREYVEQTLSPWIRRWRQSVYRCLLTVDEQNADSIYAEHNSESLVQGDFTSQTEGYGRLLEKGVYSINGVRRKLKLNPVEGGDAHFIQLNMQTIQDAASGANLPSANPAPQPAVGATQ
jgi:HK97 family phage portal protein